MMQLCKLTRNATAALEVLDEFTRRFKMTKTRNDYVFATTLLVCREVTSPGSPLDRGPLAAAAHQLFDEVRDIVQRNEAVPDEELLVELVRVFSLLAQTDRLLQALVLMTAAKVEPKIGLCDELLSRALWSCDNKVVRVLLGWYLNNFSRGIEFGALDRVFHVAAQLGDEALARLAFRMLALSGYSARATHYACWARACLAAFNLNGAIEALLEAQVQRADVLGSAHGPPLQALLADYFRGSITMLDGIYFALVDLRRGHYAVPPIVINALVAAAGKLGQLDRSFGTFQECASLFGVRPDLHTHNALLTAVAQSRYPK